MECIVSQTWFRFDLLNNAIVIGAVSLPKECPPWFSDRLQRLNAQSPRAITMEDVSALDYLEEACLQNRGIRVFRPLSPRSVSEPVFAPQEDLDKAAAAAPKSGKIAIDPNKLKIITLAQFEKLPNEEKAKWHPLRAESLGLQPRMSLVYDAIIDSKADVEGTFTLQSSAISSYVQIRDELSVSAIAQHAYSRDDGQSQGLILG